MKRYAAITVALLAFAFTAALWSGGIVFATTWPGSGPDHDYRATLAVQTTFPPRAGFLIGVDDFRTFGRPGLLLVWNNQIVADVTSSGVKTWRASP
jgi:hypothetical protein